MRAGEREKRVTKEEREIKKISKKQKRQFLRKHFSNSMNSTVLNFNFVRFLAGKNNLRRNQQISRVSVT